MKKTRIIALALAAVMVMGSSLSVFAAVESDNTITGPADGQKVEAVDVSYTEGATYTVTIPKKIVLDKDLEENNNNATFTVKVAGDISADKSVTVTPDGTFEMDDSIKNGGKEPVEASVSLPNTNWTLEEVKEGKVENGTITTSSLLTSGTWSGKFNFTIMYESAPM